MTEPPVAVTVDLPGEGSPVSVVLTGELDVSGVPVVEAAIERALAEVTDELAIEMSALDFVDARGLSLLARTSRRLAARNATLRLRHPPPILERLLDITDLAQHMTIDTRAPEAEGLRPV